MSIKETAKKLGIPIDEFILNIDKLNGRLLLINSFKNIGQSIVKVFKAIGDGWQEVIDPMSADDLFNIIAAFHKFTRSLIMTDETADKPQKDIQRSIRSTRCNHNNNRRRFKIST